ncbi:NTP transferase domain-containing protein [Candidatus Woesearchaeota archaeon]|nr:NTP transferase domain-containing protein [Candidatus Woesearchaeota archaeon]
MVSAVVLAGGQAKDKAKTQLGRSIHARIYGEHYLWGKYKPLKQITITDKGEEKTAPMLEFVVDNLSKAESINDIVIIGEKERIEKMMPNTLERANAKVIQQVGKLSDNVIEGYIHTQASLDGLKALFVPCDIPKVSADSYDGLLKKCIDTDLDVLYAVIGKESISRKSSLMSRAYHSLLHNINRITGSDMFHSRDRMYFKPYFWAVDDVFMPEYQETKKKNLGNSIVDAVVNIYAIIANDQDLLDTSQTYRRGFRMANISYGNPLALSDEGMIDKVYNARKLLNPANMKEAAKVVFPAFLSYLRGRLKISEINSIASEMLGAKVSLIEVEDIAMTLDIDSEEDAKDIIYLK